MSRADREQAVFGGFDGLTGCVGVVAALAATGTAASAVLVAAVGLAVAATVSMAAGEYLSDPAASVRRAAVMGGATLVGSLVPVVPYALGVGSPVLACAALVAGAGLLIAHLRPDHGWPRAYALTLGLLAAVVALTVGVSVLTGAA